MTTLHAHVSTVSQDCDGPIHRDHVETFNDAETVEHTAALTPMPHLCMGDHKCPREYVNDFSEIHFMDRVFTNSCGPYAVRQMRITMDENGVEFYEDTEEGYRAGHIRWCREECDTEETHYRDIRAEQAGY